MIFEQINKYDEPVTTFTNYGNQKTPEEKAKWATAVKEKLEIAKKHFDVGDLVTVRNNYVTGKVIIHSFLTDPEKIYSYKDNPCFIMAIDPKFKSTGPTRYTLEEFDLTTVQRATHVTK